MVDENINEKSANHCCIVQKKRMRNDRKLDLMNDILSNKLRKTNLVHCVILRECI